MVVVVLLVVVVFFVVVVVVIVVVVVGGGWDVVVVSGSNSKLTAILLRIVKKYIRTYLEAKGTWKGLAPEVHLCSLHNFLLSGHYRKKYARWNNLQFGVSTFSEKIALGVKMGEPGTVRILLTEGLH